MQKPRFLNISKTISKTLKLEWKNFTQQKPLAFSLHFLFQRDQNNYSNLTLKIINICEQIFKKRQHPNTIQILWIVKNCSIKSEKGRNSRNSVDVAWKDAKKADLQWLWCYTNGTKILTK